MTLEMVVVSGLLTGVASSLHCAGLCGGIASMLVAAARPGDTVSGAARLSFLTRMQLGRAAVYVTAGAVAGSLGYQVQNILFLAGLQNALRVGAALMIVTTGLSIAGLLPPLGRLDRWLLRLSAPQGMVSRFKPGSAFGLGAMLGLAPCAMVFNALLTAALIGSPASGAFYMSAFAAAALPGVVLSGFGMGSVLHRRRSGRNGVRRVLGMLLVLTGIGLLLVPGASLTELCLG